jgi:hypothetical protein
MIADFATAAGGARLDCIRVQRVFARVDFQSVPEL